jgi:hypothetical protein
MKKYWLPLIFIIFTSIAFSQNPGFTTGEIGVEMNYYGRIRLYQPNSGGTLNLWQLSILVGTSPTSVFDYWQDSGIQDSSRAYFDTLKSTWVLYGAFNNSYSNLPPNVLVKTYVNAWKSGTFALIKYVVINKETTNLNALVGLDIISQIDGLIGFDTVLYVDTSKIIDIYKQNHLGFKLLSGNLNSITSFEYYDGYANDTNYYHWMTHDTLDARYNSGTNGPITIASQDLVNINPGDSIAVYYGVALGSSFANVKKGIDSAYSRYQKIITSSLDNDNYLIPPDYMLNQNYPNPFNPSTNISFSLPAQQRTTLKVYNILGIEVATLMDEEKSAGKYSIQFNAKNLSSGIYFYELKTPGFRQVKKMLLLK